MKVLIVFNHPAPYKVRLFNALCNDVELDVIFERKKAKDRPNDFYTENEYKFNAMFLTGLNIGNENTFSLKVKNYIKKHHNEYDLIIMNGYSTFSEMVAINYLRKHQIPFILYVNGGIIKKDSKLRGKLKRKYISSASKYLSPSVEANNYLIHYGARKEDIYLYNYSTIMEKDVLAKPFSKEEKQVLRDKYQLPNGDLFVSASQFIERKNIMFLLECFNGLNKKLVLVGNGPQKEMYEKYISDNKMDNVVIKDFMKRENLLDLFGGCDYFITLSKEDIYGHTINEAMAKGLPVISSENVVAAHKLIKNNKNGFIVSLSEKESIINCINNISGLSPIESLKVARENTLEVMAKDHIKIFEELVK